MERDGLDPSIALVQGVAGDFFVPRDHPGFEEIRETGGVTRPELALLLDYVEPGMTIADVGAGFGAYTIPLQRATGPSGRVCAFESNEALGELLRWNLTLNGLARFAGSFEGEPWSRLEELAAAGVDLIDLIRLDGGLADPEFLDGLESLIDAGRPGLFVTLASEMAAPIADRLESLLLDAGYEFFRHAGGAHQPTDDFAVAAVRNFARTAGGYGVLALPADTKAAARARRAAGRNG